MNTTVDPAVHRARGVVGLYGDPSVTWGIGVDLVFAEALPVDDLPDRLAGLLQNQPHLGRPSSPDTVPLTAWTTAVQGAVTEGYGDRDPLLRVVVSGDARRLAIGAHHGACDGLGLLAVAEALTGAGIASAAQGIGDRAGRRPFLLSSAARLGEALLAPPARFRGSRDRGASGERLLSRELPPVRAGTAALGHAISEVFTRWRADGRVTGRRPILTIGASRRAGATLAPDRQTAYLRLPFDSAWSEHELARRLADRDPEPVFPETSAGGIGPRVTHALRSRLGATAIISNLGRLSGQGLVSAAMYPAASGPFSAAFGFATTETTSTLTLRTHNADFSEPESESLVDEVASALTRRLDQ